MKGTGVLFDSIQVQKTTITKKVVDYIKDLIIQGRIASGDKLPSEREMSELLNVSRNTVRESYKILATLGYVQIKHGHGVFVSDEKASMETWAATFFIKNDQINELFEIRKILETQCVKWVTERINDEQITLLRSFVDKDTDPEVEQAKTEVFVQADQDFHMALAEITGNSVLIRIMYNLIDLMKELRNETIQIPGRLLLSVGEHKKIVEAIESKDANKAAEAMLTHLNSVERALFKNSDSMNEQ